MHSSDPITCHQAPPTNGSVTSPGDQVSNKQGLESTASCFSVMDASFCSVPWYLQAITEVRRGFQKSVDRYSASLSMLRKDSDHHVDAGQFSACLGAFTENIATGDYGPEQQVTPRVLVTLGWPRDINTQVLGSETKQRQSPAREEEEDRMALQLWSMWQICVPL